VALIHLFPFDPNSEMWRQMETRRRFPANLIPNLGGKNTPKNPQESPGIPENPKDITQRSHNKKSNQDWINGKKILANISKNPEGPGRILENPGEFWRDWV